MANKNNLVKDFLAGGVGGMCLVFSGHPLDTIKVRIQTMTVVPGQPPPYSGTWDCAVKTVRQGGLMALYKGMAAPLIGVTPMYALCFWGYGIGKKIFCDADAFDKLKLMQIGMAGATSALFTTPILAPGERAKCYLQVQTDGQFKGPSEVMKHLYKTGGIASVNRGFMATLLRDGIASFFYFSTYEFLKRKFTKEGKKGPSTLGILCAGGFAGMANWVFAIPIDMMKSKLQVAPDGKYPHGIRSVFREVIAKEGITSLYRGFAPVMIRAFPANAACFLGIETAYKILNWIW